MDFEYLKSDTKRIEKKLEQLNQKYDEIQHQKELDKIKDRCEEINKSSDDNIKTQIWGEIYKDVLEIEKNTDPRDEPENKKKSKKSKKSK
jgi:hypothetical protein